MVAASCADAGPGAVCWMATALGQQVTGGIPRDGTAVCGLFGGPAAPGAGLVPFSDADPPPGPRASLRPPVAGPCP